MRIDDGLAPVELFQHRPESAIAEPAIAIARHEADAVRLKGIERVFDLAQAPFGIRVRNSGEETEAPGMLAHEPRAIVVRAPGEAPSLGVVAEPDARLHEREHRSLDASTVHFLERALGRPVRRRATALLGGELHVFRRQDVVMHIDAVATRWSPVRLRER